MTHDAQGLAGGEIGGRAGQLRDSDDFVGYSATTIGCNVEQGSTTITAQVSGSFDTRGRKELVDGSGLPNGAVVMTKSGDVMTLSAPWEGPSGAADLGFRNDHRNYAVHFYMPVPSP